jgi:hypothetical protein
MALVYGVRLPNGHAAKPTIPPPATAESKAETINLGKSVEFD